MYRFILHTHFGDLYFKSNTRELPDGEFIMAKNQNGEVIYISRSNILFYEIRKIEGENKN